MLSPSLFFSWVLGSQPWLFSLAVFLHGFSGPNPWLFSSWVLGSQSLAVFFMGSLHIYHLFGVLTFVFCTFWIVGTCHCVSRVTSSTWSRNSTCRTSTVFSTVRTVGTECHVTPGTSTIMPLSTEPKISVRLIAVLPRLGQSASFFSQSS